MIKSIAIYMFILVSCLLIDDANVLADVPESQKPEVEYLLEFIETSACAFERNGKKYDGKEASKHIKRKYKHFRDQITNTEEFIEYSGTKSTMSGNFYLIYCDGNNPIKSQDWLLEELTQFRNKAP